MSAIAPAGLVALLERYRFDESTEDALQRGVAEVLGRESIPFTREVQITRRDRIDFLVGAVGIECKTAGGLSPLVRQLHRYALADQVQSLIVLTARAQLGRVPPSLNGKPIAVVATMGGLR